MAIETIPIPRDRAKNGDDFTVRVTDLDAWPNHTLRVEFQYNTHMNRYLWDVHHPDEGQLLRRGVAVLGHSRSYWPYITFQFLVPGTATPRVDGVTPETLGDPVKLAVFPGPLGGQFLQDSGLTAAEEQALLSFGNISRTR